MTITCSNCPTGHLVEIDSGLGYRCDTCTHDNTLCESCGARMTFAADHRGTTCGGLAVVGARVCVPCGIYMVCRRSKPADAVGWLLAKGGRSLTAGGIKVRAERGDDGEVEAVMARIVRVPELEMEIERLQSVLESRRVA